MKTIKVVIAIACLFCANGMYSQPRVDGETKAQVVKSSPLVTNFVGWAYNDEHKKWCGYYNAISGWFRNNNKVPRKMSPEDMAVYDNIISLQFKKVKFEGDYYYLLCVSFYKGKYRYPAIEEDWYCKKMVNLYVFTEDEYNKLKNIEDNFTTICSINYTSYGGGIGFGFYETFASAMANLFESKTKLLSNHYTYKFHVKKENDKTIRFHNLTNNDIDHSTDIRGSANKPNFNFHYYEIKSVTFKQLLI
jgi:hypothetical protein